MTTAATSPYKFSNNGRLQRLSKTTQLRHSSVDNSFKDAIKLPALNSVMHGIKHNDISFITGRQIRKLRKDPEASNDFQFQSAHGNLRSVRTKFDNIKAKRLQIEQKVEKLEEELQKYRKVEEQFLSKKDGSQQSVKKLSEDIEKTKYQFEQMQFEKKVMLNMIQRHKKDKIFYDQKKFDLEKRLKFVIKQNQLTAKDGNQIFESSDRTDKLYQKLLVHLNEESSQRQIHTDSVAGMIEEKRTVLHNKEIRTMEIQQIAERAMQDKSESEKQWIKVLHCHKLVSRLLRDKMYKEMEKFEMVETAFKNIKIATGITDVSAFVYKFLNKESVYGELLGKIAMNEARMEQLKRQAEDMKKQQKQLEEEDKLLFQMRKKENFNFDREEKQLDESEGKRKKVDIESSKLKLWLAKNIKKFNLLGQNIEMKSISSLEEMAEGFKKYLTALNKSLDQIQSAESQRNSMEIDQLNPEQTDRVFRVKTNNKRKNSIGEQINIKLEEQNIQNPYEDDEAVDNSRAEVLKNNEKFMKMLKMKYEEIRRAKIEAMPKEKKKEPQKPKVPVIDQD